MQYHRPSSTGFIYIVIGGLILFFSITPLLLPLLGMVIGLFLLNHGLQESGYPPLLTSLQRIFDTIRYSLFR